MQPAMDFHMLINGKPARGVTHINVVNPVTEQVIATAPDCTSAQLNSAVAAARNAFVSWKTRPLSERRDIVRALGKKLVEHKDELALIISQELGKTHLDACAELDISHLQCEALAGIDIPVTVHQDNEEYYCETRHVPIGVVGIISAWNGPLGITMMHAVPALLAGNTVVAKPPPSAPLALLRMGQLIKDVLPAGVMNIVSGGHELGAWLSAHPGVDKIGFTGSSPTGKRIMASASVNMKRLTLEAGGNDPAIVLPDIDVDEVAPQLFWSAFYYSGQVCAAIKRLYIHEDIYEPMSKALVDIAKSVTVGDVTEQGTSLGPLQNKQQYERVCSLIDDARKQGLKFLCGGNLHKDSGYFVPVTIVDNPPENSRVVAEEAFGPVLPLLKFKDIDDVVRRANNTEYGLGGSVWSKDVERAQQIGDQLECGNVWINEHLHLDPIMPFGGHKQSGIGVGYGLESLLENTNIQTRMIRRSSAGGYKPFQSNDATAAE